MDALEKKQLRYEEVKRDYLFPKEEKFQLVNCAFRGAFCKDQILPEINRLYAEAESNRIDKEYQVAIALLEQAFQKTMELTESQCNQCTQCVSFFQYSIKETLEIMEEELHAMAHGFFSNARYQVVYTKLGVIIDKLNPFREYRSEARSASKILG